MIFAWSSLVSGNAPASNFTDIFPDAKHLRGHQYSPRHVLISETGSNDSTQAVNVQSKTDQLDTVV